MYWLPKEGGAGLAGVTSRDVAREAGVSQNTVSLVARDSPRVRPETKAAVRAVMARLGYHPNALAAALRSQTTPALLFVVQKRVVHDHVTAELLGGAIEGADAQGYSVLVVAVDREASGPAVDAFRARWASGALVFASGANDPTVARLVEAGCPTVSLLQPSQACPPEQVVRADDAGGARQAVEHLLARGHRRLGLVRVATQREGLAWDRIAAARAASASAGATLVEAGCAGWTVPEGREAGRDLLLGTPRPTGVFAISDRLAFGVLEAAAELGLRVPDDVAVCGFDDTEWSRHCTPPLTTVEFPLRTLGRVGAERLLVPGRGGPAAPVQTRLIVRGTT